MNLKCNVFLMPFLLFFSSGCHREITNNGIPAALATNEVFRTNCFRFQKSTNSFVRYNAALEFGSLMNQYIKSGRGVLTFDNVEELLGSPDIKSDLDLIYNLPLESNPRFRLEIQSGRPRRVDHVMISGEGDI